MQQLSVFPVLAWDFDLTLFNHKNQETFLGFIRSNPYGQKHHIITMRSHGMQHDIPNLLDLTCEGAAACFDEIHNVSDEMFESFYFNDEPDHPLHYWKGLVCKEIGANVLIDDMEGTDISMKGCRKEGIKVIHPDALFVAINSGEPLRFRQ